MPDTPNTEYALQVQALRDLLDDAQHWALASHDIGDSVTAKLPLLRALLETINAAPVVAAPAAQGEAVYLNLPELVRTGGFQGDNTKLCSSIDALLELDARNALVPHGIGGHARTLLEAAANRIRHAPQPSAPARNPHKELLRQALAAMTALHSSMQPTETHDGGIAPAAAVRAFVNEHARLLAAENLFAAAASQPSADDAPLVAVVDQYQWRHDIDGTWGDWINCDKDQHDRIKASCVSGLLGVAAEARALYAAPPADARDAGNYNEGSVTVSVADLRAVLDGNLSAANIAVPLTDGIDVIEARGGDDSDDDVERIAYHLFYTLHAAERLRALLPEIPADRAMGGESWAR